MSEINGDKMKGKILFLLLLLLIFTSSCHRHHIISAPEVIKLKPKEYPVSHLFRTDFDQTWSAVLDVLEAFPLTIVQKESGIIVSNWIEKPSLDYIYKFQDPGPPYYRNEEIIAAEYRSLDGKPLKAQFNITVRVCPETEGTLIRIHNRESIIKEKYPSSSGPIGVPYKYISIIIDKILSYSLSRKIQEKIPVTSSTIRERLLLYQIGTILGDDLKRPEVPTFDEDYYLFYNEKEE